MTAPRFAKVDASLDSHPKIEEAGFWGSTVYQLLLRINRANDFDGVIPAQYTSPKYLAKRLALFEAGGLEGSPIDLMTFGLNECRRVRLTELDGDKILLAGWDDEWRGAQTDAVRARKYRESKRGTVTDRHGPSRDENTVGDASRLSRSRVEKRREEKRREETNRGVPGTSAGTASGSKPKPKKRGPDPALIAETATAVVKAFNNCMSRNLGSKGTEPQVKALLAKGYTEPEMRAVMWWAGEEWGADDAFRTKVSPTTMLKLVSSHGNRTFPQYLELATELWRETKNEDPPWDVKS